MPLPLRERIAFALLLLRLGVAIALLPFAIDWRSPLLASLRPAALPALIALPLLLIAMDGWTLWTAPHNRIRRALSIGVIVATGASLLATVSLEGSFRWVRARVLAADAAQLEKLGRHLIVGYRDPIDRLIDLRALGGVFVGARNGLTADALRRQIEQWQDKRRRQGLPLLWIATDQEGGAVSRLSPPLTRMPPIADIVALHRDSAERLLAVRQYAARQGRDLAALGVNLNFAPVVDLTRGVQNPDDRLTRIATRAISADPAVVTEVAGLYCATLRLNGVHCTLKHFPGLGRVYEDTHKVTAELAARPTELEASDWLPFRQLMAQEAFTMLGHARLSAIDGDRPASFSHAVVKGLLRDTWKHDGILLTDDFSMGAVTLSREGAARGAIAALNAGVDLILISYDPDQYFPVMHALLAADRAGTLRAEALESSTARLRRAAER